MTAYLSESVSPSIETSNNAYKVILPNVNYNKINDGTRDFYKNGRRIYRKI